MSHEFEVFFCNFFAIWRKKDCVVCSSSNQFHEKCSLLSSKCVSENSIKFPHIEKMEISKSDFTEFFWWMLLSFGKKFSRFRVNFRIQSFGLVTIWHDKKSLISNISRSNRFSLKIEPMSQTSRFTFFTFFWKSKTLSNKRKMAASRVKWNGEPFDHFSWCLTPYFFL